MENKLDLIAYFEKVIKLNEEEKQFILSAYDYKKIKRKDFLFQQGDQNVIEAFVLSGTFRIFNTDTKGLEHVLYFAMKDWWIGDMGSAITGENTNYSAQALEDSEVLFIDSSKKEAIYKKIPQSNELFRIIIQKHLAVVQKRLLLSYSASAAERLHELLQRCPGIEQMVPQHQIASYLGILPESLSRIKKQLIQK